MSGANERFASVFGEGLSRRAFMGALGGAVAFGGLAALGRPALANDAASDAARNLTPYAAPSTTTAASKEDNPKRILVVVDYQVDFVSGGVFGEIEPAIAIEDALYDRIKEYQDAGDIVIYTMDTHPSDLYSETREATVNELHCDPETEGWQVYGKVRELLTPEKAIMVMKGTYGSVDLPFVIQAILGQGVNVVSIEIAGVSTTCRVLHNAILLYNFFPQLPLIMDRNTTAGYTDERTKEQLDELCMWGFFVKE